jgi:hypothetical protein
MGGEVLGEGCVASAALLARSLARPYTIPVPRPRSLGTLSQVGWQEVFPALGDCTAVSA